MYFPYWAENAKHISTNGLVYFDTVFPIWQDELPLHVIFFF